jgi:hypothetical protein
VLLAGAATVAVLTLTTILDNLRSHKLKDTDIGILAREKLANGKVKVVGGVFSKRPLWVLPRIQRYGEAWTVKELDSSLNNIFQGQQKVEIKL